ncbi:ISAzo13-like element transposase-related protein [Schaedlerella arabinosiphila]|uniref:ISAzo13-like element transposase-related protein n=1 Tax=Schaedlerella arabinosiphila TaxID=2044587 RepID=UPI0038CD8CB2
MTVYTQRAGQTLVFFEVVVNLIASATIEVGLIVKCGVDDNIYETGIKIGDNELEHINIVGYPFHSEWNYIIASYGENVVFIYSF